jgi:outer membrane receptor protein involved in Fe transport
MRNIFFLSALILATTAWLYAGTTGKLAGKVTDGDSKEPMPGVNIILEGTSWGGVTDLDGHYFIINVPPGRYNVIFTFVGYTKQRVENVRINVDATTNLPAALKPTVIDGNQVTIVAERPLVQKDLTSSSARISSEQMALLPLENVSQVVDLQAGVVNGHFRGGRLGEVAYLIDGLAVNDVYTGGQMISLQNNSVEEVQVISGTFNAEYGQAMSGVVNIVSKEPARRLHGQISGYTGAYLSGRKTPFVTKTGEGLTRDDYAQEELSYFDLASIGNIYNGEGNISGPLLSDEILFFSSFRLDHNDGYLYGRRIFQPSDSSYLPINKENWRIQATGDGKTVPMQWSKSLNLHEKLIFKPVSNHKITYEFVHEKGTSKSYDHKWKYNPDGLPTSYNASYSHMLHYDYVISPKGFINIKLANLKKEYESYLYEKDNDLRYMPTTRLSLGSGPSYYMAGTDMSHSFRRNSSSIFKSDLTYQIDRYNQIKMGVESRFHDLYVHDYQIRVDRQTDWKAQPVDKSSPYYNEFSRKPVEFSAFLQDRVEWSYFIMNFGLRYDRFKPDGVYPADLMRPDTSAKINATTKSQLSPRFGIALPVAENSVLHLSYGLFFQIPPFAYLYLNPLFKIPIGSFSEIGNTNLEPQKTATYEIGLQHEVNKNIGVDLTVYYKDIRNLLGMEVYTILPSFDKYARYVNRDYGQVFGLTLAMEQRSDYLDTKVDYTLQIAEGNASDPRDVYLKSSTSPPTEITKQLIFLDWDRTHSLNFTATVHNKNLWNLGIIGRLGSGFPYTPELEGYYPSKQNDERKPGYLNFDTYFSVTRKLAGLQTTLFAYIYNFLDIENEVNIYTDTGTAKYTIDEHFYTDDMIRGINTVHDYYYRPNYLSAPRELHLGLKVDF